jgi:hypothetical protein
MDFCADPATGEVNYHLFWSVPAAGLTVMMVFLLFSFSAPPRTSARLSTSLCVKS